jgi:Na+/melibiose symporter-like transporter
LHTITPEETPLIAHLYAWARATAGPGPKAALKIGMIVGFCAEVAIFVVSEPLFQTQALVVICLVNRNISRFELTVP